jgi:hypothetical protein
MLCFIQGNIYLFQHVSSFLQFGGTLILALFSFYGFKNVEDKDAYLERSWMTVIIPGWLWASRCGLIALLLGIFGSWLVSLASFK